MKICEFKTVIQVIHFYLQRLASNNI